MGMDRVGPKKQLVQGSTFVSMVSVDACLEGNVATELDICIDSFFVSFRDSPIEQ
jgi:hypothetical protein